ncbi:MAG: hypothetical protein N838_12570 [Thiohalocapsa sp. PB-PSB1]|nr:MAG: hypothetical protein N838_12570 [Thiohalocapsa sp. PB-PSB1]
MHVELDSQKVLAACNLICTKVKALAHARLYGFALRLASRKSVIFVH